MRVSVVVCTLNRADALAATLRCLQHQDHTDFEVVVVNGPSTDSTLEVLEPWRQHIRYFDNPERNLSISRNIGLRASSGDVVAFIDDDALPEPTWLTDALPAFDDPEVGGAGGIVFDHTGMGLQYKYTATNRLLQTSGSDRPHELHCFPGSYVFPYLQGTNQIYRRDRLLAVGGFDENIFFYGDDCDIAGRIMDAGWIVRQLPNSAVHHKYLASGIRDHQRITTNWFPVIHDHTYFALRHASAFMDQDEILHSIHEFMHTRVEDTRLHETAGRLPAGSTVYAEATCLRAFAEGLRIGVDGIGRKLPVLEPGDLDYQRFPTVRAEQRRRIVLVSSSYTGNITGGVGRLFSDLAPALAARGHDVRVITRATGPAAVDFEDGVWVHRVDTPDLAAGEGVAPDVLAHLNEFATASAAEVARIRSWTEPDVVFAPLWDLEGLGVSRSTDLPVALHVSTPLAVIGPMAGYLRGDGSDPAELRRIMDLESELLQTADAFQANTDAVQQTVQTHYGQRCDGDRWRVLNIGLRDHSAGHVRQRVAGARRRVFFAGRFEARKGIDTLLEAMSRVLPDYEDVELVLVGEDRPLQPGERPVGESFVAEHRSQPWARRVSMLGVVDDDALHDEYARADLVVLPSRYESFGLVMAEAMMHGKPLVSTDGSGVREVVRAGVDGLLVPPGDAKELEAAIRLLLEDQDLARTLGEHGRQRFQDLFAIERVAERFDQFLRGLASAQPAPSSPGPVVVRIGERLSIDVPASTATVVLVANATSSARLLGRTTATIALAAGQRARVRIDADSAGALTVVVDAGEVVVERFITVEHQPEYV